MQCIYRYGVNQEEYEPGTGITILIMTQVTLFLKILVWKIYGPDPVGCFPVYGRFRATHPTVARANLVFFCIIDMSYAN